MSSRGFIRIGSTDQIFRWLVVSLWFSAGPSFAETAVNTYTTGDQNRPAVAADGQGRTRRASTASRWSSVPARA